MHVRLFATLITCAALAACATGKSGGPVAASEVQVYNSTQLVPNQYNVVDHIWIDSSRSALGYPRFGNAEEGVQAMKEAAGKIGAKGVINVLCMDGKGWHDSSVLCYGDAITLNSTGNSNN